jgi:hypothetical protein
MDAHVFVKEGIGFRTTRVVTTNAAVRDQSRYYERRWSWAQCGLRFFQFGLHPQGLEYLDGLL